MAALRLLNLFALSSLAVLVCTLNASPVTALSGGHQMMQYSRSHDAILAKRVASKKRCKAKKPPAGVPSVPDNGNNAAPPAENNNGTTDQPKVDQPITNQPAANPAPAVEPPKVDNPVQTQPQNEPAQQPATPAPSPPAPVTSYGKKVGIAWPLGNDPGLDGFNSEHLGFGIAWDSFKPAGFNTLGVDFIPMLWGLQGDKISNFQQKVVPGYANWAAGFNECNEGGQANLSPQDAANGWRQFLAPLGNQGYKLLSPSVSSSPAGEKWMDDFFLGSCADCHFDAISLHWYGLNLQDMIDYATRAHNKYGKPIMMTEYACHNFGAGGQANADEVWAFHKGAAEFFEKTDWVVAYFAFGAMHDMVGVNSLNQLLGGNNQPTTLGNSYKNVQY